MKQFKDLEITGPTKQLLAFFNDVSANLPTHWRRDYKTEAQWERVDSKSRDSRFALTYEVEDGDPSSRVYLVREDRRLFVPNITPLEAGRLSIAQYNRILDKLAGILKNHRPPDSELEINLSRDDANITDWVSPTAAELLERFSTLANKSTGSSHPNDFERWVDFLIKVHEEDSSLKLSGSFLARWMEEELGWSSDGAIELSAEYEFARDLLRAYDSSR